MALSQVVLCDSLTNELCAEARVQLRSVGEVVVKGSDLPVKVFAPPKTQMAPQEVTVRALVCVCVYVCMLLSL